MITTAENTSASGLSISLRHPAIVAILSLCAWAAPASGQAVEGATLPLPDAPPRVDAGEEFWERLREEAHRFREEILAFRFARRYEISTDLARMIREEAEAAGVDPELGFRLVYTESRFNPRARGPYGALGLTQLMPRTARWLDRRLDTRSEILEPRNNLRTGFGYLRRLIEKYDGDVRLALLAYNRGEGAVDGALRRGRNPENGYSRKVLGTRGHGRTPYRGDGLAER